MGGMAHMDPLGAATAYNPYYTLCLKKYPRHFRL